MSIERIVMAFAGFMILLTVALGLNIEGNPIFHHQYWLFFTAFVGFNLLQSSFTGFCPLAMILKKMGKQSGNAF